MDAQCPKPRIANTHCLQPAGSAGLSLERRFEFLLMSLQSGTANESCTPGACCSGPCPSSGTAFCCGFSCTKAARPHGTDGHNCCRRGFGGGSGSEAARPDITYQEPQAAQPAYQQQQQQFAPCQYEMKQFLECAQNQTDLKLCEGFSEVLKQCRFANGLA
uniref:Coiled-coil-helix-coiled-coil-helix domain containing 2 n=1 Tax=Dromaius novaehollandiae TaxID=8790 RepID=A0A8C4JNB2_DRONO